VSPSSGFVRERDFHIQCGENLKSDIRVCFYSSHFRNCVIHCLPYLPIVVITMIE
jgi:hypothetical protein